METTEEELVEMNREEVSSSSEVSKKNSLSTGICNFFSKIKKKIQGWFPEVGMFNRMSISEEEKEEIKD